MKLYQLKMHNLRAVVAASTEQRAKFLVEEESGVIWYSAECRKITSMWRGEEEVLAVEMPMERPFDVAVLPMQQPSKSEEPEQPSLTRRIMRGIKRTLGEIEEEIL